MDEQTHGTAAARPDGQQPGMDHSPGTLAEAIALHAIEGNPLDGEDIAMFEMFEHEGWPPERRRAHIIARARRASFAAE